MCSWSFLASYWLWSASWSQVSTNKRQLIVVGTIKTWMMGCWWIETVMVRQETDRCLWCHQINKRPISSTNMSNNYNTIVPDPYSDIHGLFILNSFLTIILNIIHQLMSLASIEANWLMMGWYRNVNFVKSF